MQFIKLVDLISLTRRDIPRLGFLAFWWKMKKNLRKIGRQRCASNDENCRREALYITHKRRVSGGTAVAGWRGDACAVLTYRSSGPYLKFHAPNKFLLKILIKFHYRCNTEGANFANLIQSTRGRRFTFNNFICVYILVI